jgi:hypothetical protein
MAPSPPNAGGEDLAPIDAFLRALNVLRTSRIR